MSSRARSVDGSAPALEAGVRAARVSPTRSTWLLLALALAVSLATVALLTLRVHGDLHALRDGDPEAAAFTAPLLPKARAARAAAASLAARREAALARLDVPRAPAAAAGGGGGGGGAASAAVAGADDAPPPPPAPSPAAPRAAWYRDVRADVAQRDAVRDAFLHAWRGYEKCAWGRDELRPISCGSTDDFGLGLTILDSLSTLWVMGLRDEFAKAREWVANSLNVSPNLSVSVFETTIRCLGGLLSAFELSRDAVFLGKARELGEHLLHAFDHPSGLPHPFVHLRSHQGSSPGWHRGSSILAEFGTLQLEFVYLAHYTNDSRFAEPVLDVLDRLISAPAPGVPAGLFPNHYLMRRPLTPRGASVSMGALGDSAYEYLLKLWLMGGARHERLRAAYERTARAVLAHMRAESADGLVYVSELVGTRQTKKMDHLACFSGGMLALGAAAGAQLDADERARGAALAGDVAHTCVEMYRRQPSGLAPESVTFARGQMETPANAKYYLLRPETVETLMYQYRITGEQRYRDDGAAILAALLKHTRVAHGFSGVRDVTRASPPLDDLQQTFLLAETFKYLYLLFDDASNIPLDRYVFNTEAHPLGRLPRTTLLDRFAQ